MTSNTSMEYSPELHNQTVYVYHAAKKLFAIESSPNHNKSVVLIGGLTDGPLSLPYTSLLAQELDSKVNYSLIQPMLSSSFSGYGHSSIAIDVEELDILVEFLLTTKGKSHVVLIGHSTGAQDVVNFLIHSKYKDHEAIQGGILQGAVSDRQWADYHKPEETSHYRALAERMIAQGRGQDFMPREVDLSTAMTGERYFSLHGTCTSEDLFSSDLVEIAPWWLESVYGKLKKPIAVFLSGKDEYVPPFVSAGEIIEMITDNTPRGMVKVATVVQDANHNLSNSQTAQTQFVDGVLDFIKSL